MNKSRSCALRLGTIVFLLIAFANGTRSAELTVQIRSPKDGSTITQEQAYVLVGGKVGVQTGRAGYVDIFLVIDVSASTALYAGVDFSEFSRLPNSYVTPRMVMGRNPPPPNCASVRESHNLRVSILSAEIAASRRLLSQLNPETTRVGVITFGDDAWLRQPLTHDFEQVRSALDLIYKRGPSGKTNMVDAILLGTEELLGKGESEKYLDSIKTLVLLTDGVPTLPSGDCSISGIAGSESDIDLTINTARQSGNLGISVHVLALGEEALSNPRAAVGIARESGGTYTAVTRPADVLAVVDKVSAVGVDLIQVSNETIQQQALQSRLAADGFFASAVPVVEGLNRIQVVGRASDGSLARDIVTVEYLPAAKRSLDLEIFLEREKNLKLELDRLDKSPEQIQREVEAARRDSLKQSLNPFPAADNNSK
jgi:von Willebrand factor type A domain-containing protein